jgi:hypothetical protein
MARHGIPVSSAIGLLIFTLEGTEGDNEQAAINQADERACQRNQPGDLDINVIKDSVEQ